MQAIERRLAALQKYIKARPSNETVFLTEDGREFRTRQDIFSYLLEHGAYTPDGCRIVRYPHPSKNIDPLSLSLYQLIDEAIKVGYLDLLEGLEEDA